MKVGRSLAWTVLFSFVGVSSAAAQSDGGGGPLSLTAHVNRSTVTIGDRLELTIEVVYSKDTVVQMPGPNIDTAPFEILKHQYSPLSEDAQGNIVARSVYTLAAFSTGELEIPSISVSYRLSTGGDEENITTEPISINVESVLAADTQDIKDIKPPIEIPRDWLFFTLALAAATAALALILILWRRRRASRNDAVANVLDLPPHIAAYRALRRLSNSALLDQGEVGRYHVELSEIVRHYFAGRFGVDALEMTSQELLASLPGEVPQSLPRDLLGQCDLVKFARSEPSRTLSERALEIAFEIVETTKPRSSESGNVLSETRTDFGQQVDVEKTQVGPVEGT